MSRMLKHLLILLLLGLFLSPQKAKPTGGALEYNRGGDCVDPYSITSSEIIRQWPIENMQFGITQYYRWVHPAIDIPSPLWTPIEAVGYGFVIDSEYAPEGYGWHVIIQHPDNLRTLYAHMVDKPTVKVGDYTYPGKVIGYVGSTGNSTGPHLHFEVLFDNCNIDPYSIIEGHKK